MKTHTIGHNWLAMMAGLWSSARKVCPALEGEISTGIRPASVAEMYRMVIEAGRRFTSSPLCSEEDNCELLLTGFIAAKPEMLHLTLSEKKISVDQVFDKWSIGEGALLATAMLNYRGYACVSMPIERACYLIYEAKKFSELVDSVSSSTRMMIHARLPSSAPGRLWRGAYVTKNGLDALEEIRRRAFIQPIPALEAIWPEGFDLA